MSCKCTKVNSQSTEDLLMTNPKIAGFLSEKQEIVANNVVSAQVFKIVPQLVNGTKDRYSKKSRKVKELSEKEIKELFALTLNDNNYDWSFDKNLPFDPSAQILLKDGTNQFMFLYSKSTGQMSVIDIEGQQVFKVKEELINYFDEI